MRPAGLAAFAKRREDRSGVYAYENRELTWSDDYEAMLRADPSASAFWDGATPSYRKVATNWVLTAKQEATRDKRMAELVEDCATCASSRRSATAPSRPGCGACRPSSAEPRQARVAVSAWPWAG